VPANIAGARRPARACLPDSWPILLDPAESGIWHHLRPRCVGIGGKYQSVPISHADLGGEVGSAFSFEWADWMARAAAAGVDGSCHPTQGLTP
jgi:hypothetical protein